MAGQPILVVEDHEVAEFLVPGQRIGLGRDALHEVPVGGDDVHVVVEGALSLLGVGVEESALASPCLNGPVVISIPRV